MRYKSLSIVMTCIGELSLASVVNDTMSEKQTDASANSSGSMCEPAFSFSATLLRTNKIEFIGIEGVQSDAILFNNDELTTDITEVIL